MYHVLLIQCQISHMGWMRINGQLWRPAWGSSGKVVKYSGTHCSSQSRLTGFLVYRASCSWGRQLLRVVAGPGSGKTRVLTRRIAHLIKARPAMHPYIQYHQHNFDNIHSDSTSRPQAWTAGSSLCLVTMALQEGAKPWQILAVTFTNKAAGEMKERLEALLGEP